MRIFVFAIGGTGTRVLRSLSMLLAAGCKMPQNTTVVPIILDYDLANGDTTLVERILETYQIVRKNAYINTSTNLESPYRNDSFFATPIIRLDEIPVTDGHQTNIARTFHVEVEGSNGTFGDYIGYNHLTQPLGLDNTACLMEALYNDNPAGNSKELHLNLNVGFKGNPNIGSVVFDRWTQGKEFQFFEQNTGAGDRIFVISSIFGGTGAAGFPKLIQTIRSSTHANVNSAKIGAAVVMPYFKFADAENSAITATIFNTKTKAALNFYESCGLNDDVNALYYLSDDVNNAPGLYNNAEGGAAQRNQAHIIELLAASAIMDFANKTDIELNTNKAYEFGLEKDTYTEFNISYFGQTSKMTFLDNMSMLTYFARFFRKILPEFPNASYIKDLGLNANMLLTNAFYKKLQDFLENYSEWLKELSENNMRKFEPYKIGEDDNMRELLAHKVLKKTFFSTPLKNDFFHEKMTKAHDKYHNVILRNEELFLQISRDTMQEVLSYVENYKL